MNTERIIQAFDMLGRTFGGENNPDLEAAVRRAGFENAWFTDDNVRYALKSWSKLLNTAILEEWVARESLKGATNPKKVAVIMAGNIPLVGLHDLLSVLISGHKAMVKLSKDDTALMQFVISLLQRYDRYFNEAIEVVERVQEPGAVIATGSNNTARYFEYYFGKYPNIIRKNRNSVAILTGEESSDELDALGDDIFRYFGLGCRNVTKIYVPAGYELPTFYDGLAGHYEVLNNSRYANNYTYHKAILLMNLHEHLDNNFILLKKDRLIYSPIGCLNYDFYSSTESLLNELEERKDEIQVVVSSQGWLANSVPFGESQQPALWDYSDGVNTVKFLKELT